MASLTATSEPQIRRLDFDTHRSARSQNSQDGHRSLLDNDVGLVNEVVEGIIDRDRKRMQREVTRAVSFVCAVLSCLCAGSITSFSLYGPRFLTDLRYTQYQVNTVSIVAELAMYLPVPLCGYLCDRYSPQPLSLIAAVLFGSGYLLAAFAYRAGPTSDNGGNGWPFWIMVVAFIGVGAGTASMYLSAVATCAKNFAQAKYRGFMLAVPIAAFGLSGMWLSQVGDHLLSDRLPNGRKGHVNVFKYFVFLAGTLIGVGVLGGVLLRIVDEEDLIDHGIEHLEQSGLLEESEFFRHYGTNRTRSGTGTHGEADADSDSASAHLEPDDDAELNLTQSTLLKRRAEEGLMGRKKTWLLNHATHAFLSDRTMWLLAAGFFLVAGAGDAYINNVGTIIPTLTPRHYFDLAAPPAGSPSTHVSIIALTSTFARLFTGTLSDLFAPSSNPAHPPSTSFSFSRLSLLLPAAALLMLAFLNLALPFLTAQNPPLFLLSSALLGLGYGAAFSLVPIVISVIWGVENFATNWGIVAMMPAGGAAVWSIVYSVGYSRAYDAQHAGDVGALWRALGTAAHGPELDMTCRGYACYSGWAWGCTAGTMVAIALWAAAWRVWRQRNVIV